MQDIQSVPLVITRVSFHLHVPDYIFKSAQVSLRTDAQMSS